MHMGEDSTENPQNFGFDNGFIHILFVENLATPGLSQCVFESTVTLSSRGEGGISQAMTTGYHRTRGKPQSALFL